MILILLVLLSVVGGCAVEAGNPTSKTPKGIVKLEFLQASNLTGEQLTLHLDSVSLRSKSTLEVIPVALEQNALQLFASDSNSTELEAGTGDFPIGSYDRVVIRLPERKPPRYRNTNGIESDVSIDSLTDRSFYLEDSISIEDGKTTIVSINLDPIRSISKVKGTSKDFRFIPRGGMFGHRRPLNYEGATTVTNASFVCAYGYGLERPPFLRPDGARLSGNPPPRPEGIGPRAQPPQAYETRESIEFDSDDTCEHAFAKAVVLDGKYSLMHLPPGAYALRFFSSDGTFRDQSEDIKIQRTNK